MSIILLVDSDQEFRESVSRQLQAYGFEVAEASSAPQALEAITRLVPCVVVVDVELPAISGMELIRHVRSRGHFQRIACMILTKNAAPRHVIEAARLKVSAYLSKRDFRFASFLQRLVSVTKEPPPAQILFPTLHGNGLRDNSVSSEGSENGSTHDRLPRIPWKTFLQRLSARAFKPEATRILHQCCSPDVTLADLEESVKASPMLAVRILTTANSAAFNRGGKKLVRLSDAIAQIGLDQLRNLVSSSFFEEHFLNELQEESSWRAWQFGLACGRIMEELRGPHLNIPSGSEYVVGVGLSLVPLIFAQNLKDEMKPIKEWHEKRRFYNLNLLEDLFGIPVDEACRGMLERVGIPELIVEPLISYTRHAIASSDPPPDPTSLALDLTVHFASAMFFPLSPFFPLRPLTCTDLDRLPTLHRLPEKWSTIRQEVLVRSFELARDSEVVRDIVARPYFTRRDDIRVEVRMDPWAASFGPIRLFLSGICQIHEPDDDPQEISRSALVLVSDDPESLLEQEDAQRSILVLHRKQADPAGLRRIHRAATQALPCNMANLTQAVHAL